MNEALVVFGLLLFVGALAAAIYVGHRLGVESGRAEQAKANALALEFAEARAQVAEAVSVRHREESARRVAAAKEAHAAIERQREELIAAWSTGDIERALAKIEEANAKIVQDLQRIDEPMLPGGDAA